jgi:flavin reductase (DIM6/NTAB) family NADH-FMN oxidoreductase RutF
MNIMKISIGPKTSLYPDPVLIVGTYDREGNPNAMTAAWGGICCSNPPSIAVSVQPPRHTFTALMEQKAFTVSIPSTKHVKEVDYLGVTSGKNTNKFADTGLTPVRSELVNAPYVGEFPVVLECDVIRIFDLGMHTQFIGEIIDVKVDEGVMGPDGKPDVQKIKPFCYDHLRQEYYGIGKVVGKAFSDGRMLKK